MLTQKGEGWPFPWSPITLTRDPLLISPWEGEGRMASPRGCPFTPPPRAYPARFVALARAPFAQRKGRDSPCENYEVGCVW